MRLRTDHRQHLVDVWGALVLFLGSLAFFLLLSRLRTPDALTHDGAYFLNLADQLWRGNGFVSPVLWWLYLAPEHLPMPYAAANGPLLSILIAGLYGIFGNSFFVAHIPTLFFASLLAPLTFGLSRALRLDVSRSFVAGVVIMVHPLLVPYGLRISADTQFAAFAVAFLILLYGRVSIPASVLLGVVWGLAYLTRYQAVLLAVPLLIALLTRKTFRFRHAAVAGLALLVTVSPWLARNYLVFGEFMHSWPADYFLALGTVPMGIDLVRDTAPPPPQLPYVLDHIGSYVAGVANRVASIVLLLGSSLPGNIAVFLGCVVAVLRCWKRWRRFMPLIGLAAVTIAFFVFSYLEYRYLMILCPMLAIAGVTGLTGWRRRRAGAGGRGLEIALISLVLVLSLLLEGYREARAAATTSWLDRAAASRDAVPYFSGFDSWSLTIMGEAPEYHAYFHDQYAISTPLHLERDLAALLDKYGVDFMVVEPWKAESYRRLHPDLGSRLSLVHETPRVLVYQVVP